MKEKHKSTENRCIHFQVGDYLFDYHSGKLTGDSASARLEPQVCEFLYLLVRHAGETVSRETIAREIWPRRVVGDDALRAMVKKLRDALGDNARDPRYIKTLPLKGYSLIAPTRPAQPARDGRPRLLSLVGGTLVILLLGIGAYMASGWRGEHSPRTDIEPLTGMPGSELSPDYSAITDRLLFSHRANKDDYLQLYVKHLATQRVQRLTWDQANYANAFWSPDGSRLIYTRSTDHTMQHFAAEFDPARGILNPQPLPADSVHNQFLLGWSMKGDAIYLKDAFQPGRPQGIWRFDFASASLEQVTAPNVQGIGDYFARESRDGKMLALLRSVEQGKRELLIVDRPTGSLLHTRILPQAADRLSWHPDNRSLILSGFDGVLLQYQLASDRLETLDSPSSYLNDVFFQCGDHCFFMRRHNGNFLDLQEEPAPFADRPLMATDHFDLPGAEDFPLYAPTGDALYFVSRRDHALLLQRQSRQQPTETLATLPGTTRIKSLAISTDGTYLAGLVDKRIFTFDLAKQELRYLTTDMDLAGAPTWIPGRKAILYSVSKQGLPTLYEYDIERERKVAVTTGFIAARQLDGARLLAIDARHGAWLLKDGETLRKVGELPSTIPNRWQVQGQWLYYTAHAGNDAYMHRINLYSGATERQLLARNRFRLNFDLHPELGRMAAVKSTLAESDLVKLSLAQ